MKAKTWSNIYKSIENHQWDIEMTRPNHSVGIAIMTDQPALEWQRLDKVRKHVGCHYCAQKDRERGMKNAFCVWNSVSHA